MKIFNQLGIILGIWAVGELISSLLSNIITMPGTIIGMIILFLLLQFKIMKEETIKDVADFLLGNMAIFFVPAGVSLINSLGLITENMLVLLLSGTVATIIIMIVTGKIVEIMINKKDISSEDKDEKSA
ncbi:MAG: CidA/LrgA family protein [Terrisporobacter sp.]|uniref:CidA/LrgA family protein n=3 Tax=Terrisporobacter sp. TaxID=1965305 RepID=UPI002A3DEB65|nr:CidA/LrgA family protein [Terrisporobacter sp.]MCI6456998.1 CidA/LrgA family protein [Clostridium sp.]MCI7205250.1 CidA/LrgA family protein [Clostridium sp.]MDD5878259.1 CidA/LrgA family protein [Clostridiales bacterium]MDY6153475.1 CidA/LrgA family protein [Terrisporobacter sp.]